ncbi:MAG TPA: glutamine synthetase family protein [Desulfosporosinus sp.]|nr:glutamine synthetase family protein [Desulfosporosinus sp.]
MALDSLTGGEMHTHEDIKRLIKEHDIEMIRLEYTDILGINRGKLMPVEMIDEVFENGISFGAGSLCMGFDNSVSLSKGFLETIDDMKVVADLSTFVVLPHEEKTALLLGDMYYHGQPMQQSPRAFLKRIIQEYHKLGLDPIAASELEFFVYKKRTDGGIEPYTNQPANCYTSNKRSDPLDFLSKLTKTFKKMDFNVLYMNHEYFPSQFEYNWSHAKALRCADETTLFKGISKDIAELNNMMVTFMGKPKTADGGSGCHFHISLNDLETGKNVFGDTSQDDGIAKIMKYFIGGICKHALPLTAFLAPTVNCYKRYQPDSFAPIYIGWGYDNRTTYIRIPQERGKSTRVEVRAASAATNPYLALGGMLAAGLDGIQNKIEPPEVITTDVYHDETRQQEVVPRSLFKALTLLEQDQWLCECISQELIDIFVNLKTREVDNFARFVTDWEWDTYSYHV